MESIAGLHGEKNVVVLGSKKWLLDYYFKGPPPIAVELLTKRNKFFEKIVKLLDILKSKDARTIIVASRGTIDQDYLNIATNFRIYVVMKGDERNLKAAISGDDLLEVNNVTRDYIMKIRNRRLAKECRAEILDVLGKDCLTYKELTRRLKLRFNERTVYAQLRSLRLKQIVIALCRRESGEAVFGLPGVVYPLREDLSKTSRAAYIKKLVLNILRSEGRPISYLDIMKDLGLKRSVVTSALRDLKRKGEVARTADGWKYAKNQSLNRH